MTDNDPSGSVSACDFVLNRPGACVLRTFYLNPDHSRLCLSSSRRGSRSSDKSDWLPSGSGSGSGFGSGSSSRNSSGSAAEEQQGELVQLRELLQARGVSQQLLNQLAPSTGQRHGHTEGGTNNLLSCLLVRQGVFSVRNR